MNLLMSYWVYIIQSQSTGCYYCGQVGRVPLKAGLTIGSAVRVRAGEPDNPKPVRNPNGLFYCEPLCLSGFISFKVKPATDSTAVNPPTLNNGFGNTMTRNTGSQKPPSAFRDLGSWSGNKHAQIEVRPPNWKEGSRRTASRDSCAEKWSRQSSVSGGINHLILAISKGY